MGGMYAGYLVVYGIRNLLAVLGDMDSPKSLGGQASRLCLVETRAACYPLPIRTQAIKARYHL